MPDTPDKPELDFSVLLAASVHDMKNSVAQITQLAEGLQEFGDETAQRLFVESGRLNQYLVQLLALYKLGADQYPWTPDSVYLAEVIEDAVAFYQTDAATRGISIISNIQASECEGDRTLLTSAINGLVFNALQYAQTAVQISFSKQDDWLVVTVEDDGSGFDEAQLGELDDKPIGVDLMTGSTGFGLYFAQQVAAFHRLDGRQGYLEINTSSSLGGAAVSLFLP